MNTADMKIGLLARTLEIAISDHFKEVGIKLPTHLDEIVDDLISDLLATIREEGE